MCIINLFVYNNVRFKKKYMTNIETTLKIKYYKYGSNFKNKALQIWK